MDQTHFHAMTQTLTRVPSRRDVLRGLAGAGIGLDSLRPSDAAEAKNKKSGKKKRKKDKKEQKTVFNQYGCLDVGQACKGNSALCCSGVCQGVAPKKGKTDTSRCVAHNTSLCTVTSDLCSTGRATFCHAKPNRACALTTGNAAFCADFNPAIEAGVGGSFYCRNCRRDTDCQAEFGPGAACVVYGGICSEYCAATGGTACMPAGDA